MFELLVGGGEFAAADVKELLAALGVVSEVVDAALGVLHLLDEFFEFGHSLGIGHLVVFFHCLINYELHNYTYLASALPSLSAN